jgi:hypothetical protein
LRYNVVVTVLFINSRAGNGVHEVEQVYSIYMTLPKTGLPQGGAGMFAVKAFSTVRTQTIKQQVS